MKAIVSTKYGAPEVLQFKELEKPIPKNNEVLVRIYATSVTAAHCAMRKGKPLFGRLFIGLTKPKISIPGTDFAGEIEATGNDIERFKVGDQAFGATDVGGGCYAEYICISEQDVLVNKPVNIGYDEASAVIDGATTALAFLRDYGKIKNGQKVLINGASGGIGVAAVQLAKYYGADVTGVCSTKNIDLVKSLGADRVIDYTNDDFTKGKNTYDIIFDTVGKSSFKCCKGSLTANGVFLSPVLSISILFQMLWTSKLGKKKAVFAATGLRKSAEKIEDLIFLNDLIESEKLKAVIDRQYPLEEIVDAHRYVEKGHKKGNVVISLNSRNFK